MAAQKAHSTLTTKGQVTIPEAIRELLQLQAGDRLEWKVGEGGAAEVRKVGSDWRRLIGLLGRPERHLSTEQMDARIGEHVGRKHARR